MHCRGLNCRSAALIKAHIIPKAFGRHIRDDGPNMSLSPERVQQAFPQLGDYDSEILCASCDNKLGAFDEYGISVCRIFKQKHILVTKNVFELSPFDGDLFGTFILSILWRGSISSRKIFSNIELGPYEDKARNVLFGASPLHDLRAFQVIVLRYTSKHLDMDKMYSIPSRAQFDGINTYSFGIGGFRILAKFDNRRFPKDFSLFEVNGGSTLRGFFMEFEGTPEFRSMKDVAVGELRRREQKI